MLEIAVFVICRVKERVCQLFEVFQHEFANLSLPCEGRFRACCCLISIWAGIGINCVKMVFLVLET